MHAEFRTRGPKQLDKGLGNKVRTKMADKMETGLACRLVM